MSAPCPGHQNSLFHPSWPSVPWYIPSYAIWLPFCTYSAPSHPIHSHPIHHVQYYRFHASHSHPIHPLSSYLSHPITFYAIPSYCNPSHSIPLHCNPSHPIPTHLVEGVEVPLSRLLLEDSGLEEVAVGGCQAVPWASPHTVMPSHPMPPAPSPGGNCRCGHR